MMSFAYKCFDGRVPEPGVLDAEDRAPPKQVEAEFETVGDLHNPASSGRAWTAKHPSYRSRRTRPAAATTVYVTLQVVGNPKTILASILPYTCFRRKLANVESLGVSLDSRCQG
jgi:hypothetical protein